MARIPEDLLARVKREVAILDRVRAAGLALTRHGANWVARCPWHDDHTPSLVLTPAKNLWHCLGACQVGGSVVDWEMRWAKVSFREAVERLRPLLPGGDPEVRPHVTSLDLDPTADDATLLGQVVGFYHRTLGQSPEALAYLERRGLRDDAALTHFQLGFANRTLAYQLPPKVLKAGAAIRGRLQALGVLRESGHEHFNGSLVVPIQDGEGRVVGLYGRKVRDDLRPGTPVHLYLPGPHRAVWNARALTPGQEVILCEALLDALTFWVAGHRAVTTSYGVHGFTPHHRALFRGLRPSRVLIAYDPDVAGDEAAVAHAAQLAADGIPTARVRFPRGQDANAYARMTTPADKSLGVLLRAAIPLGDERAPVVAVPDLAAVVEDLAPPLESPPLGQPWSEVREARDTAPSVDDAPPVVVTETAHALVVAVGSGRTYRVRGLAKNAGPETLRVTLVVRASGQVFADSLDLYSAVGRQRVAAALAALAQTEEALIQRELGTLLLTCEQWRDQRLARGGTPNAGEGTPAPPPMSPAERAAALELLQAPDLIERLVADVARAGVVGETTNVLVGYLATISRKLPAPLAVIIQSQSAAGKTSLMDAILAFVPPEDRVHYAALTGQALYYLGETALTHKVLSLVEEEGAERASYALKLLQSEGELTIASTGKDPHTGKLVTQTYRVQGPVQLFLTTTALALDEELANRALVLTVDETTAQTQAIHVAQRAARTLDGLLARADRTALLTRHQHAQRLLAPLAVVNPHAPSLGFGAARTRTRRDHAKYLTLIDAIALLHQHQRPIQTVTRGDQVLTYVEATAADVALANRLAAELFARTTDELPPQTRRFLGLLTSWVTQEATAKRCERTTLRFRARDARAATGLGATQVKLHLARLVELELVLAHRAAHGLGLTYSLTLDEDAPAEVVPVRTYDPQRSASGRPPVGGRSATGRTHVPTPNAAGSNRLGHPWSDAPDTHLNGAAPAGRS
jgi:DNA primase catalytic core